MRLGRDYLDGHDYTLQQRHQNPEGSLTAFARRFRNAIRRSIPHHTHSSSISPQVFERLAFVAQSGDKDAVTTELDRLLPVPSELCRKIALAVDLEPKSFSKSLLSQLDGFLSEQAADCQSLYLPTYRRIEKDLSLIFPDLDEAINSFQRRRGMLSEQARHGYIELVEFGMEDVEGTFRRERSQLIERARSELNALAGGYLRDVIRGEGEYYEIATFRDLDDTTINRILNSEQERTLSDADKTRLRAVIDKLRTASKPDLEAVDRYIAHFFSGSFIKVDGALSEREQRIAQFTEVCNKYLIGKSMVYDDKDSSICARLLSTGQPLPLRFL